LPQKFWPPPNQRSLAISYAWLGPNKLIFSSGRHFYISPLAVQKVTTPLAIISASINIFAQNFVRRWKIGGPRGHCAQKSGFRNFKMAKGRHLEFRFWATTSASINIFAPNLVSRWKIGSRKGPIDQKSCFRK